MSKPWHWHLVYWSAAVVVAFDVIDHIFLNGDFNPGSAAMALAFYLLCSVEVV